MYNMFSIIVQPQFFMHVWLFLYQRLCMHACIHNWRDHQGSGCLPTGYMYVILNVSAVLDTYVVWLLQ